MNDIIIVGTSKKTIDRNYSKDVRPRMSTQDLNPEPPYMHNGSSGLFDYRQPYSE
ncbi:hypothetical protein GCM10007362_42520 [Saccharibacillus endophyticus]|uniref:Uncharacterized protein n=1 Tax=Saccharibacillus endophyticus TaxID=2060666 RepID=A0ABQ2A460_9BACL|nr:hypothetical protein GCM10007362_42520 [Saccharibacillus endophyticus]